jgi:hypothetical protein
VSGLTGSGLVLQSNSGEKLAARNGTFTFQTTLTTGTSYYVVVSVQPGTPTQSCSIANGTGTIGAANVTDVVISCEDKTTNMDSVGGMLVGAQGPGLVLQNNGTDNLTLTASGAFKFPTQLPANSPYSVSVLSPPLDPYQDCIVTNSPGTTGASDVANVVVSCTVNSNPKHTISVNVQSVTGTITLQNNGRDSLTVSSPGTYPFSIQIPTGSPYKVIASAVKGVQSESCTFQNGSGVVGGSDIDVLVSCAPAVVNDSITASVSGLSGTLVLEDNGGDNLSVTQNGLETFATALAAGTTYNVTVFEQPANQTCTVSNGSGTAGVTNPAPSVSCGGAISGTVAGLSGTGLVLQDNGGDNLPIGANGPFTFPTMIASGSPYNVTVLTQPTNQTCTVSNGTGTAGGNIPPPAVACVPNSIPITVTVVGLNGTGLVIQDNGRDNLQIAANGRFTFPTQIPFGSSYSVTVLSQPTNPAITQQCAVTNGSGTAGSTAPPPVVTCPSFFTVGGSVTGVNANTGGQNLVLQNSNGDTFAVQNTGPYTFTFPTPVLSGSNYAVTIKSQPGSTTAYGAGQTTTVCVVAGGTGTVTNANITSVTVNCVVPTGFAYVTNSGDNSVSAYLVDQYGALLPSGPPVPTGTNPSSAAAFVFSGNVAGTSYLYVTNQGSNDLSVYTIDPNTGALTAVSTDTSTLHLVAPSSISQDVFNGAVAFDTSTTFYVTGTGAAANQTQLSSLTIANTPPGLPVANLANSPFTMAGAGAQSALAAAQTYDSQTQTFRYLYLATLASANELNAYPVGYTAGIPNPYVLTARPVRYDAGPTPVSVAVQEFASGSDTIAVVYTANLNAGNAVIKSNILDRTGTLTPKPHAVVAVDGVNSLVSTPASPFLNGPGFLFATGSQGVWEFVPGSDGSLTTVEGSPFSAGSAPGPGPLAAFGSLVYVVNVTDGTVYVFSNVKGVLSPVGNPARTGVQPSSIVVQARPANFS